MTSCIIEKRRENMRKGALLKKVSALGLSLMMAASLAGCGQSTDAGKSSAVNEQKAAKGDPVEISIAIWNADQALAGDDVMTAIEEKLNIKIKPMNITWDDYTQKIPLWASSGSLPDVFVGPFRTTSTYPQWANQGVIKAIPENLDAYSNLKTYLEGQAAQEAKLDGTLYCIPRQTYPSQEWTSLDRVIVYRWDLAQKAGIEKEPETWEEFQTMMKAIIKNDPDGTGIGGMTADGKYQPGGAIMPYASPIVAENGTSFRWVKAEDGLYKPAYFEEDVVAGFQLARDMYDNGVIEKDIALVAGSSGHEKFLQGKSAAIAVANGFSGTYESLGRYWEDVHETEYLDDVRALDLMPDKNGNKSYSMFSYAWSESYINAEVSEEKLDKILQLYDYLLSDEGAFLSTYGPEGNLYDMVDGKVEMHEQHKLVKDVFPSCDALGVLARWNPSTYDERFVSMYPEEYQPIDKKRVEQAAAVEIPEYNPECTQLVMELGFDFSINFDEDFLNIMTGQTPVEQMWAELCEQYEAKGLTDMIDQVNEALAEK